LEEGDVIDCPGPVKYIEFSPDGRRIATSCTNGRSAVTRVDDPTKSIELGRYSDTSDSEIVFSPDGRRVATGSGDGVVRVHDVETGSVLAEMYGHDVASGRFRILFAPDGKRLVTLGPDRTLRAWNAETG